MKSNLKRNSTLDKFLIQMPIRTKKNFIDDLIERANFLIENKKYILYKSSIGILKTAVKQRHELDLKTFVPIMEKKAERLTIKYKNEQEAREKREKEFIELLHGEKTLTQLEKELEKMEKEKLSLWKRESQLRPDERTQRKATIKNRQCSLSREMARIQSAIKIRKGGEK